jgi:Flp pilus assembly pilin Flp
MLNQINRFMLDESGIETVEWAIVGGVISVGVVALFIAIGQDASCGLMALKGATSAVPYVAWECW